MPPLFEEPLFEDLRWRGLVHQATDPASLPELLEKDRLVLYAGFDPSAPSLHVGHLQLLILLRRFQDAGHRPIALVGGGTGMIGDPSGKSEERNLLSADQLDANRSAVASQIGRLLDTNGPDGPILADNADWLVPARLLDFLREVGKHFSVNAMIRKDSVRGRLEGREQFLSFTEFSYMLLQSWDYVELYDRFGCRLQLGGSDQWGNISEGVDLIRRLRGVTAYGLTSPLVTKTDGTKFGKTESGSVWLDPDLTSPYAFYQFYLRTADDDAGPYLRRFTLLPRKRIEELEASLAERPDQREAQRALAREMTSLVHGPEEAVRAEAASAVLFNEGITGLDALTLEGALQDAPTTEVPPGRLESGLPLAAALVETGLASSNRDARTLLQQGSVYVNGRRAPEDCSLGPEDALHQRWIVLRRGRGTQHVLVITDADR